MTTSTTLSSLLAAPPLALLLALTGACVGTSAGNNTGGVDGGGANFDGSGGQPDNRIPMPDVGTPTKIGSNCQAVDTQVLYENTEGRSGWLPRIAWANDQYGVVWTQEVKVESSILAYPAFVRVSPEGQPAGAHVQLSDQPSARSTEPVGIAGLSAGFAVVWGDKGDEKYSTTSDIILRRIDAQGRPEGAGTKITSSGAASYPYLVRPAFVGVEGTLDVKELALGWRNGRNVEDPPYPGGPTMGRYDIYFKVVNLDGSDKVAEKRITTDDSPSKPLSPMMAHDGQGYALVWKDSPSMSRNELIFVALDGDGALKGAEQSLVTNHGLLSSSPDLVAIGPEYGVAYSENPSADTGMIRFSRIDRAGTVMGVQQVGNQGNPCTPAVAFNGERYALVWQDDCGKAGSKLVFAIIDDGGNPLQADGTSCYNSGDPSCGIVTVSPDAEGTAAFPEMISVGGKFAVTWMNAPQDRIYFSHVACSP